MKKLQSKHVTLLLIFALFISLLQPITSKADFEGMNDAIQLEKGNENKRVGLFDEPGQVHWYKIIPSNDEISKDTHMSITLTGNFEGNVSVYPDIDRAQKDETFDAYRTYLSSEAPAQIDMPHAWAGPYYIRVEFFGEYFDEMEIDEDIDEPSEPISSTYEIEYEGAILPPSDLIGEACPVELSVDKKEASGTEILTQLRFVRDNLLSKTEKGEELSSLYYKMAPYLVSKMVMDKDMREKVYKDLVLLKPLFKDIVENGENSNYPFTERDQEKINELYNLVLNNVPDHLKKEIEGIAKEIGLTKLQGKKVSVVLKNNGMAISQSDTDRVIVKLKKGKTIDSVQQKAKKLIKSSKISSLKLNEKVDGETFVVEANHNPQTVAKQLTILPEVEYAEPVYKYNKLNADVQYPYQWSLKNTGKYSGKKNADIQYEKLQPLLIEKEKEIEEVLIAVVDTGVDYTLADFEDKIDIKKGYDFVNRDKDPSDDEGHGTHVSGIIAASSNNGYSMTGINPKAKILPVKVLNAAGEGESDKIALGIKYAVDKGAKVINLSLGGPKSRVIEEMLKYADSKDVTVIAASGNDGGAWLDYPASSPYTIAVGATNSLDIVSDFSNYGRGLDMVAPGREIPSLLPNGNVTYLSGTSMAAPHVAAVAGLLLSQKPKLKPGEVKQILTQTANDVAVDEVYEDYYDDGDVPQPGYDKVSGWGRLNAWGAFSAIDLNISVNELSDNDKKITGEAVKGIQVELKNGKKSLGKAKVKDNGTFSITIKPQMADQILQLVAKKGKAETSVRVVVQQTPPPSKPKVNAVSDRDEVVTGKADTGTTVKVKTITKTKTKTTSKVIGTATANTKGQFKVKIKKQKAGTTLYVTTTSISKKESEAAKVVVKDKTPPAIPKVKAVSDRDQVVSGSTEANAMVIVKKNQKSIGTKKADAKGKFKVTIKKQKAGTVLYVTAKDAVGNVSKAKKVVVKDKTPPASPKVNGVTDKDKFVTGTAEAKAMIVVKLKGKTIASKKADAKGKFKIKIKKQKAGTVLYVTAKDAAGNISKGKKITVKKFKK
ncbi:S8 family peptidase [Lederbergia citrea]|uniref:S8 family peptidase n=1 Tax=Lederbergia citrea TaxID=2833581 RepID=UPI001BC9C1E7|nr:Ig-like domain-containing protein [Lederbergia citrea]MBS4177476.1 S8 family serine peptidase [Lederbergia citrea]